MRGAAPAIAILGFVSRSRESNALFEIDWYIRRYCRSLRGTVRIADGSTRDKLSVVLDTIHNEEAEDQPAKHHFIEGHLEDLLRSKGAGREQLVWKNFYFGKYHKGRIKRFTLSTHIANPANFLYPEIFPILNKLVQFSHGVTHHLEGIAATRRTEGDKRTT